MVVFEKRLYSIVGFTIVTTLLYKTKMFDKIKTFINNRCKKDKPE